MPLPTFETDTAVAPNLPDFGTAPITSPSPVLSKVRTAPEMQISAKDPGIKPMGAVEGAASILNLVLEKLGRGAVGAYNKVIDYNTAHLSPDVRNEKSVPQRVEYGKPLVDLSSLSPAVKEIIGRVITAPVGLGLPQSVQRGVGESATKTLSGFSTPENIALMPALPLKPVQAVIGTQMALNSPASVAEAARTVGDPGKGTQEKTSSIVDALTQLAMTGGLLKGAMSKGEVTKPATPQEMTGVQLLADQVKKGILTPEQAGVDASGKSIETPVSLNLQPPRAVETPPPSVDLTPVKAVEVPPPTVEAPKLPTFEPEVKPVVTVVAPVVEQPKEVPESYSFPSPQQAAPEVKPSITPEQTVSLQHDLKGVAGTIASAKQLKQITPEQATELQNDGDQIFTQLMTDNDYTKAQTAVENLRKKRDSFVSTKPKETPASLGTPETKKPDVLRTAIEGPKAYVPKERITDVSPTRIPGATADLDEIARKVTTKGEELTPMENAYLTSIVGKPEHQAYLKKVRELRTGEGSKPFTDVMPAPPEIERELKWKPEQTVNGLGYKSVAWANAGEGQTARPSQQYGNRLRNLFPEEYEVFKSLGFEEWLKSKERVSGEDVQKWVEENGPKVEVRKFGQQQQSAEARELAKLQHEWKDALPYDSRNSVDKFLREYMEDPESADTSSWLNQAVDDATTADASIVANEFRRKALRYAELGSSVNNAMGNNAHWSSIAPKTESDMPGYVEGVVVIPSKLKGKVQIGDIGQEVPTYERDLFPSSHSFPPNTLGFFRGYMETLSNGRKVFHVIEVQSDWAQATRRDREAMIERGATPEEADRRITNNQAYAGVSPVQPHPLLRDWSRLTLKAAVDHAIKEGANEIAVSDAETAMLTEGHDQQGMHWFRVGSYGSEAEAHAALDKIETDETKRVQHVGANYFAELQKREPTQAPGMRLNYDRILPSIASELTGEKGRKVELGEHKMAYDAGYGNPGVSNTPKRPNLIFRNPDSTPKTSITAHSYDLSRVKKYSEQRGGMSILGKDKPVEGKTDVAALPPTGEPKTFTQAIESVDDSSHRTKWEAMDLKEGDNINDVIRKIAAKPEVFGKTYSGLAKFLDENFSHVLPIYSVTHESHPVTGRATINLDQGFRSGNKVYLGVGSDATTDPAYSAVHEAAHAAIHWQFMYPKTGLQRKAAAVISDIMAKSVESLPEEVRKFYTEVWEPFAKDNRLATRESWRGVFDEMHKRGIEDRWSGVMFSLGNPSEFLAQSLSSLSHQSFLADWKYEGKTAWVRFKDAVKDLLGIKSGTALDAVIDQVITVGKEADADAVFDFESKATMTVPPTSPLSVVHDATTSEKYKGLINAIAGRTAPKTSAASVDAANNLIRYASARIAAPLVARSMATDVLGRQQHDPVFSRLLGSIIVEDQLRGVREGFRSMAAKATDPAEKAEFLDKASKVTTIIGKPESPLTSKAQFTRLLKSPAIAEAIQRHNNSIMPVAEQAHKELGGASARGGEATGAFANLIAILSPDDVEGTRALVYGSRQGELTNPLKRGSSFSKQRRGTASTYELDYRTIAERMIRGNYEQKALRDMYKSLVERGLAVEEKPGVTPPRTLGNKPLEKVTIEIRGAGPGQTRQRNLWIRSDVAQEVRQALATDSPIVKGGLGLLLDAATDVQIVGVTDAWWHTVNMAAAISTSQGGKNIWVDVARKIPGVAVADAVARVSHQYIRTLLDDADVQRELKQIAEVGAGRAAPVHRGILTKGAQALGLEGGANPFNWSANFIKAVDKAGRLSLNKMYDNLVERELVKDTPEGRREFINKMGQYNSRLMGQVQKFAREISLSSFVVAGRNFNRLAMQKLLMDPGVDAANPGAAVKMRAVELFGWTSALLILPVVANHAINGTLFGRPGTPYGSIDTGKDDESGRPIVVDPLQTMLLRRGLRISGAQSLMKDVNEGVGVKRTAHDMANDIFQGIVHPWTGPAVRTGKIAVSGYDTSGYLVSRNPDDHWENVKAALKNANPMIAAYLRGKEATGTKAGGVGEVAKSTITRAVGVGKSGSLPSWEDRVNATTKKVEAGTPYADTGFSMLPIGERRKVQKELDTERSQRPQMDETLRREMARRSQFRGYARLDALSDSLPDKQRSWLKANNLHLTEFKDELTAAKTRIPFTRDEEERFATIVAENYKERLTALMQPDMESTVAEWKKSGRLQKMLDARLDMARKRARATMRSEISKKASGN